MDTAQPIEGSVYDLPWISRGVSAIVCRVSEAAVIKAPLGTDESQQQLDVERAIYERLSAHPHITTLHYIHNGMIVLEQLRYPLRKRLLDLRDSGKTAPIRDVLRWARQTAKALHYIHSCGVFQVDIGPHNILLDWDENAKLSDFAGSSIDGSEPQVLPSLRAESSQFPSTTPSVQSELFALGSTLYEMETTLEPYHDKEYHEIETLFQNGDFPDTSGLTLGAIISKCWAAEYTDATEVVADIGFIQKDIKFTDDGSRAENDSTKRKPWLKSNVSIALSLSVVLFFVCVGFHRSIKR